ncbi:hypothetical protein CR203_11540 [Salipaludibacillus neizhouensis]|uniref:Anti-sigma-W factor RsiW n=1 Tax=Salipaludibacillus neizhouensis TaxID=885475 RepID=A0A3A9K776_9BACI|nr:anti-sigma factor [Salipaludibacillus neizhouensis]RKL67328.1 hypothetical protein CR203_11540 [Salipaludibacillus neizhouensis]
MTERQCDQVIDYFNDQLSDEEKREFEDHLRSCKSCQEELNELRDLTSDFPFLTESEEPPQGMKKRVLASVFDEKNESETMQNTTPVSPERESITENHPGVSRRRRSPIIFGTLAAALLLSVAGNGYLWNEARETESEKDNIAMERDILESDYNEILAQIETDDEEGVYDVIQTSNLSSIDEGEEWQGKASIIAEGGNIDLVIQVEGLPPLNGTETFQAWLIEGETPLPAGNFNIDENGNGAVTYRISDLEDFQIDQIAITLEPQPYNETPEGDLILASPL